MENTGTPPYARLANEIAVQFTRRPFEEASEAVAAHIRKFWDPRMRGQLMAHAVAGGEGLHPIAAKAAELLQQQTIR
jgi:formate dehydrogenase subunit delta